MVIRKTSGGTAPVTSTKVGRELSSLIPPLGQVTRSDGFWKLGESVFRQPVPGAVLLLGSAEFPNHTLESSPSFGSGRRLVGKDGWTFADTNGDGRVDIESGPEIHVADRDFDGKPDLVAKFERGGGRIAEIWTDRLRHDPR